MSGRRPIGEYLWDELGPTFPTLFAIPVVVAVLKWRGLIPDVIDLHHATPFVVALVVFGPLLGIAIVARSRNRSMHYLWWALLVGIGPVIALVVILGKPEKPRDGSA